MVPVVVVVIIILVNNGTRNTNSSNNDSHNNHQVICTFRGLVKFYLSLRWSPVGGKDSGFGRR